MNTWSPAKWKWNLVLVGSWTANWESNLLKVVISYGI